MHLWAIALRLVRQRLAPVLEAFVLIEPGAGYGCLPCLCCGLVFSSKAVFVVLLSSQSLALADGGAAFGGGVHKHTLGVEAGHLSDPS